MNPSFEFREISSELLTLKINFKVIKGSTSNKFGFIEEITILKVTNLHKPYYKYFLLQNFPLIQKFLSYLNF